MRPDGVVDISTFEREALAAKTYRKESKTVWGKIDRKKNLGWLTT